MIRTIPRLVLPLAASLLLLVLLLLLLPAPAAAEPAGSTTLPRDIFSVTIPAEMDNTIYSEDGTLSNGAGDYIFAGRTGASSFGSLRRALLQFDIAGNVPAGVEIMSATLDLYMNRTQAGNVDVSLHTVNTAWGEGTSDASLQEGGGAPATTGDATWTHAMYDSASWTTAGGDYDTFASATTTVGGTGHYQWQHEDMAFDVWDWLNSPNNNHGWILIGDESVDQTAKRFGSRTNPVADQQPQLTVYYAYFQEFCEASGTLVFDALPTPVTVTVTNNGDLFCLAAEWVGQDHPQATTPLQTGEYWRIDATTDEDQPATGYSVSMSVAHAGADDNDKICRYDDQAGSWDCALSSRVGNLLVRENITQLSDWTVGNNAGPTAVTGTRLETGRPSALPLVLVLVLFLGMASLLALPRRRRS